MSPFPTSLYQGGLVFPAFVSLLHDSDKLTQFFHFWLLEKGLARGIPLRLMAGISSDSWRLPDFSESGGLPPKEMVLLYVNSLYGTGLDNRSIARAFSSLRNFYRFSCGKAKSAKTLRSTSVRPAVADHSPFARIRNRLIFAPSSSDAAKPQSVRTVPCSSCFMPVVFAFPSFAMCGRKTVDPEYGTVRVTGKGNKQRIVPVDKTLSWQWKHLCKPGVRDIKQRASTWLFVTSRGPVR